MTYFLMVGPRDCEGTLMSAFRSGCIGIRREYEC